MPGPFLFERLVAASRGTSEDRAEVIELRDALVVVVADGAGGVSGGASAADSLVEQVRTAAESAHLIVPGPDFWVALPRELRRRSGSVADDVDVVVSWPIGGTSPLRDLPQE